MLDAHADFRPTNQHVRHDTDVAQDAHRLLTGLGLEFARRPQIRHQRQMNEQGVACTGLQLELPRGLQKRLRLDVAGRAADLTDHDVDVIGGRRAHRQLDLVGDMGNDLHGRAEITTGALAGNHIAVDPPAGVVAVPPAAHAGEALVMPEVQVGFRAVVRHKNLAMLIRRHGPGVDIQIGVELLHGHAVTAAFEQ